MKVAIISFRTFKHGGVERYAYELVNSLAARNEVHLFTHECSDGIHAEVHMIPAVGRKDLFSVNSFMAFLKKNIERDEFDLIHTMGPLYLQPDIVTAHICQKRLLQDQNMLFGDFSRLRKSYWGFRSRIATGFQQKSFGNARRVIAVSSMLADELRRDYGIQNITVVYPGISKEFFDAYDPDEKEEIRDTLNINKGHFVVLFVGSQWERKGLRYLIKAMKHLDDEARLMIVGNGNELRYRELTREHGVEEKVHFQGFRKDIVPCYLAADVLVLPSLYEPFGYPVLEAMAMGLPAIASRHVGAAELITEGETGFIVEDVQDSRELSARIADVRSKAASALTDTAREKAGKLLWEHQISSILSLYEKVRAGSK